MRNQIWLDLLTYGVFVYQSHNVMERIFCWKMNHWIWQQLHHKP